MLNRLLLVSCICIVIALILYFFYWNRFIAFLVGQAFKLLYWNHEASSIWVEIGSIHFSLLAGRILIKDFHYYSSNQTLKIVRGQIQWRYWIRRPTTDNEIELTKGEESKQQSPSESCRIHISFQGFEWFLYNRSAAYDSIISQLDNYGRSASRNAERHRKLNRRDTASPYPPSMKRSIPVPTAIRNILAWLREQLPSLDPKDLLPLGLQATKGAIILGNLSTPNLLVAEFQSVEGTYGLTQSKSKYDLYRQILDLSFQTVTWRFIQNDNFLHPMSTLGEIMHKHLESRSNVRRSSAFLSYRSFARVWRQLKLYGPMLAFSNELRKRRLATQTIASATRIPRKSKKAIAEDTPIGADFSVLEYAIERKILEAPLLEVTYYVDVVGEVPDHSEEIHIDVDHIGNGDIPPEWGIDLVVKNGIIRYGPWADRQRVELQKVFFPPSYQDAEITPRLNPGDERLWTTMHFFVELQGKTVMHIPLREASKDWQWDGLSEIPGRPRRRDPAFLSFIVGDRSSIRYVLPMIVNPNGYESTLEVHLDKIEVESSLNDSSLVVAESCRIRGEMPSPIRWNAERRWVFTVITRQAKLYLLRDHINMFTDLGKDWASGPAHDWQIFVPTIYILNFELHQYGIYLYANDQNIIDKPREDVENFTNALLVLRGSLMKSMITLPSNSFRPESTLVTFHINFPHISGDMSLPRWNIHALHGSARGQHFLISESLTIHGSYRYFADVRKDNIDQLKLNFKLQNTVFKAIGWSIRYFMVFRDNYFGSFTHFSTLSEYLCKRQMGLPVGDPIVMKYREGKSNMLQVEITLLAERSTILSTAGLLGYDPSSPQTEEIKAAGINAGSCIVLTIPEIQLHLRLHDYYMEMSLNVDAIRGHIEKRKLELNEQNHQSHQEIFLLDGVDIVAHRLFGPQPRTATYLCIWEINLGRLKAKMSAQEAQLLAAAGNAFRLNYVDTANAPAGEYQPEIERDVTFYKISLAALEVTWQPGCAALVLSCPNGIQFNSNDLGAQLYQKISSLRVPRVSAKILLTGSSGKYSWLEAAEFVADGFLDVFSAPQNFEDNIQRQINFVRSQDKLSGRLKRMLKGWGGLDFKVHAIHTNGVYLPQPSLPRSKVVPHRAPLIPEHQGSLRPPNWRLSSATHISESDGEEGISEADRDARLAKTRSLTPIPLFVEDDVMMSDGDESDDADLTDGTISDSDWSDPADTSDPNSAGSLLLYYSPLTHHYISNHSGVSGSWEGLPFIKIRDGPLLTMNKLQSDLKPNSVHPTIPSLHRLTLEKDNTTIFFICNKMEAKMTPLILNAVSQLEEDIAAVRLDPELHVDILIATYIGNFQFYGKPIANIKIFVSLPLIDIRVFQHIPMLTEDRLHMLGNSDHIRCPSKLDITSIMDLRIRGVSLSGCLGGNLVFKATCQRASLHLDLSMDRRAVQQSTPTSIIFDLFASDLGIELLPNKLISNVAEVTINIGHRGPELVITVLTALQSNFIQLAVIMRRLRSSIVKAKRNLIWDMITVSANRATVDPLSIIQPSYLIQCGDPKKLRNDPVFRLLFHLRHCLWDIEPKDRIFLHRRPYDQPGVTPTQLISLLQERLVTLDPETSSIPPLSSLNFLLSDSHAYDTATPANPGNTIKSISLLIEEMHFKVFDPSGGAYSGLSLSTLDINFRSHTLDLFPLFIKHPASMSQASLRSKGNRSIQKPSAIIFLGNITLTVFPHLMEFAQQVLHVHRQLATKVKVHSHEDLDDPLHLSPQLREFDLILTLKCLRIQAAAENLMFEIGLVGVQTASILLSFHDRLSMNYSVLVSELYLLARSPTDTNKQKDQDILASLTFSGTKVNSVINLQKSARTTLRLVVVLRHLHLSVPRSVLRLYHFVEEWRADFLPGIKGTVRTLLSELHATSNQKQPSSASQQPILLIHAQIEQIKTSLQVMHGTWLSLLFNNSVAYLRSPNTVTTKSRYDFGLQTNSIVLNILSKPTVQDAPSSSRVRLVLPPISIAGSHNGTCVESLTLIDFIELRVKPSHWDTLLSVQQKFGQDFNDLLTLMQKNQQQKPPFNELNQLPKAEHLQYTGFFKMKGFRIGLEGMSSTVYLDCINIGGALNTMTGLSWNISLSDLALSLASRRDTAAFNMNHRSAFVTADFKLSGNDQGNESKELRILVPKINAVMQPSSIGEVGDFIDHLQAEMLERQEQRAQQLSAFKEKTQRIFETFEVKSGDVQLEETTWLTEYAVKITIRHVGVAFPLTLDPNLEPPRTGSTDSTTVRAFLFSIKLIEFGTFRGEIGEAVMKDFAFQFIASFRQSTPADYSSENHKTQNRLIYPEMNAQIRSSHSAASRRVWVGANVSGFILDLDSDIADYVFSLIDVYRQGKERVERISAGLPRTPSSAAPSIWDDRTVLDRHYTSIPTSNIFGSLSFLSGKVRVYSGSSGRDWFLPSASSELTDDQILETGGEVFNLPGVSVWAEYRATPASQKIFPENQQEPSILLFKSTIHSSQNTLRPQLLPFVTELVSQVEARMRKISSRAPRHIPHAPSMMSIREEFVDQEVMSSMRISFSLRIDRSKLELTCQPDVNVIAGLHWESGGFVVNVSPGARKVSFTGSVDGLTIGLKHGFLSEDCVKLDARNLAFSVSFSKRETEGGAPLNSISVVLDTEFHGTVRFSRFQDVLCFKAVWLDRIPLFNSQASFETKNSIKSSISTSSVNQPISKQGVSTGILVRIRQIQLQIDLGQSITNIFLDLKHAVLRTKLTELTHDVSVFVYEVAISAIGNLSGRARVPNCLFQTTRRSSDAHPEDWRQNRMLELRLTSGALVAVVVSDNQRLLHYRAEPLEVEILDDWSTDIAVDDKDQILRLSFTVRSPNVVAVVTVGTIPKLQSYVNKFKANLDFQRQGASRESATFRSTRSPRPENPLSAVAEAMLHSARRQFKQAELGFSYAIRQHMSLQLDFLQLIVFPRAIGDLEIAQFIGRDVRAQLNRDVASESNPAKSTLHLSMSLMKISKFTRPNQNSRPSEHSDMTEGQEWLDVFLEGANEAEIVGLPSMKMYMLCEEMIEDNKINIIYDFKSQFLRTQGMRAYEDIYITLNVSLYSWLTLLRKNLTRELEQVRATAEWRALSSGGNMVTSGHRKKVPEPLPLGGDMQKSVTLPTPNNTSALFSMNNPLGARASEQPRSSTSAYAAHPSSLLDQVISPTLAPTSPTPLMAPKEPDNLPLPQTKRLGITYQPRTRYIERLTMRQLGDATPDVMHPFFMKKAGFNLEDSLPQYVHEYATTPLEEIMEVLLKLYSRQLLKK